MLPQLPTIHRCVKLGRQKFSNVRAITQLTTSHISQLCTLPPRPQRGWTCSHDLHHRVVRFLHFCHATGLHWRDEVTQSWHFQSAVSCFHIENGGMSIVRQTQPFAHCRPNLLSS